MTNQQEYFMVLMPGSCCPFSDKQKSFVANTARREILNTHCCRVFQESCTNKKVMLQPFFFQTNTLN